MFRSGSKKIFLILEAQLPMSQLKNWTITNLSLNWQKIIIIIKNIYIIVWSPDWLKREIFFKLKEIKEKSIKKINLKLINYFIIYFKFIWFI